jgi:hypothetical protein
VTQALTSLFTDDPPLFLPRAPYGYYEPALILRDLMLGGFVAPELETVEFRSTAPSPMDPAIGFCQGSPLRAEIEARGSLDDATDAAAEEVERRFGAGPVDGKIQAHVVTAAA